MQPQRESALTVPDTKRRRFPLAAVDRAGRMSLERWLPLMIVILLAVLLGTSLAITYGVLRRTAELSARDRLQSAAESLAGSAGQSAQGRATFIASVAGVPAITALLTASATPTAAALNAARAALRPLREGAFASTALEVWSADGRMLLHEGPATAPAFSAAGHAPDTLLHTPIIGDGDAVYAWTIVPLRTNGRLLGHVASQLFIGGPANAAETVQGMTGEDVTIYVRNRDGSVWIRHPSTRAAAPAASDTTFGVIMHTWPGQGRTIAAIAAVAGTPWDAVMEVPLGAVIARANSTAYSLGIASITLMLIGTVLAWLISLRVARPIVSLTHAAEAIAAGDYDRRVQRGGTDEVGRLAASFNQMASVVAESQRALIQRVREAQEARLEAERLRASAEQAREQAERASRARGDFLAVMSHELRTPLNAIGGYAQLLELGVHGPLNEAQLNAVRRVEKNQAHLLTLINDVLSYAKLDSGKVQYRIDDVAVADVFRDMEPLIAPQVLAQRLQFLQYPPDRMVRVKADRDKLHQILLNLLSNALKHTPRDGRITLSCSGADGTVSIHVRDTGSGVASDRLESIFEPFFQGDRALSNPTDGVGLGLAISRDLARGMAGDLHVWSSPGVGSVFTVVLPRGS